MKKNTKKQTKQVAAQFAALASSEAETLVIGVDVGDRQSRFSVRTRAGELLVEGWVETTPQAIVNWLSGFARQRVALETGTHSRWLAELLDVMGHEVIVANARKLELITHHSRKSDKVDARMLSKMGAVGVDWLHPVYQRRRETHVDLTTVRMRDLLLNQRTGLINAVRGVVKSFGCRLRVCDGSAFGEMARTELPEAIRGPLSGVLDVIRELDEQIYRYDCEIQQLCDKKYAEETKWLLQVNGVGPITALTFALTIEDPERFENSRDVGAYLGLVAAQRQSGNQDPQLGITKEGDELLRKLLVNCAHHILGWRGSDSDIRRWGLALLEAGQRAGKKGARKRAAAAVARKLAVVLHVLWKQRREYEPLRVTNRNAAAAPAA